MTELSERKQSKQSCSEFENWEIPFFFFNIFFLFLFINYDL